MKRSLGLLFLISPLLMILYLRIVPGADLIVFVPLFHFYIVTFTTFAAVVISILLAFTLGDTAAPRHLLAAFAFAAIGVIFFSHGVATPGALRIGSNPIVAWSAWLTLFVGGAIYLTATWFENPRFAKTVHVSWVMVGTILFIAGYFVIAIFRPDFLVVIGENVAPWHQVTIFILTLILWLLATVNFYRIWRQTGRLVDGVLTFISFWLALASISMHQFPAWNLSWWLYHFLLLISFLMTIFTLIREYEQAREFNLLRYFLAVSLNVTALLVLVTTDLFSTATFNTLSGEIHRQAQARASDFIQGIGATLDPTLTPTEQLNIYTDSLESTVLVGFYVYDNAGRLFSDYYRVGDSLVEETDEIGGLVSGEKFDSFSEAMAGRIVTEILEPGSPPTGYAAVTDVYSIVTYAPLPDAGSAGTIGVAELVDILPDLTSATLEARVKGILISAITTLVLFLALLLVVRRGDRILSMRAAELNQAYNDLRRSEAIRDDLTRMVVHDLRNPLSAISASIDLLRMVGPGNDQQTQFTDLARSATRRMSSLVDDILTVSKYEAGELELKIEDTSIPNLVVPLIESFHAQAEAEEKVISIRCPPGLRGTIDPQLIIRVLDNLIGNALKYIDRGTGQVIVEAYSIDDQLSISVRDNGVGIADEYKTRVFDKFVQAPQKQGEIRKGTGLGLAFCRMVVEAHGGQIWAEDTPGGGSNFTFRIPHPGEGR